MGHSSCVHIYVRNNFIIDNVILKVIKVHIILDYVDVYNEIWIVINQEGIILSKKIKD